MVFNLKKQAQPINITDQASFDAYVQMLMTQINQTGILPQGDAIDRLGQIDSLSQYGSQSFIELMDIIKQKQDVMEQQENMQNNMISPENESGQSVLISPTNIGKGKNKMIKPFNLKKAFDFQPPSDPMGLNDFPEMAGDQLEDRDDAFNTKKYNTHADLNDSLIQIANTNKNEAFPIAWREIQNENPKDPDSAQSSLKSYFQDFDIKGAEQKLAEAKIIYNFIYGDEESTEYNAEFKEVGASVQKDLDIIKKMAQKVVDNQIKNKKSYNQIKVAQHKTIDNAILWGPGQTRIDPFLHQPVSDWHIVERNKGFGLVVDDIWNIDYETIWRENIMDKYSRPYKNKEGEWVGGYINKRFEVDRNIPETNNLQLKPGQIRRPILPEYGNTESRLQAARAAGEIEGANDTSKPFNWKEASKKKS